MDITTGTGGFQGFWFCLWGVFLIENAQISFDDLAVSSPSVNIKS